MILITFVISQVLGWISQSEVEDPNYWLKPRDHSNEYSENHFCGVKDDERVERVGEARSDGDWSIDDFDDSIGWREGDGLQLRWGSGSTLETNERYWRPENAGGGKFGEKSNGTLIGIHFPMREPRFTGAEYPVNTGLPLRPRRIKQLHNFLNMLSDWSHGCINFVDVNDPKYAHRITQSSIRFLSLWRYGGAYADIGGYKYGCSVNCPYWGRVNEVYAHELFHCIGQPHTAWRSDYLAACEGSNMTVDEEFFTPQPYHSVMGGPDEANRCDLKGAEDNSIEVGKATPTSVYDIVNLFPEIEGVGHCDMNAFKAFAESERCASRGPLPYKMPLLPNRRCDMIIDCPYEDVYAPPSEVDEGAHCMEHC